MALRIWLPLDNNSFTNRGMSTATAVVESGGTSFVRGGKTHILSWSSVSHKITIPYQYASTNKITFAMWVLPNMPPQSTDLFGFGSTTTMNRVELVSANYGSEYRFYADSSPLCTHGSTLTTELLHRVWSHVALTADGTTVRFYINGVQVYEGAQANTLSAAFGGATNIWISGCGERNRYNGHYNDFRVYDHVLSHKEISELAKGLILHIPMYCGYTGVGTNIAKNTNNTPAAYTIGQYWTRIQYDTNFYGLQAGDQYTFSFKVTAPAGKAIAARVMYYTNASTNLTVGGGNIIPAGTTGYTSLTATIHEAHFDYAQMELLIGAADVAQTADETCYVSEVKLEKGTVRTPWIPDASSSKYNSSYAMKDCSGNQVPVGITGTVTTFSGDSPRYGVSGRIDGSTGCLWRINDPITTDTTEFTISVWFKTKTTSGNQCIWNGRSVSGESIAIFLIGSSIRVDDSIQTTSVSVSTNTWYHLVVTWKLDGNKVIYLNGEQKTSVAAGIIDITKVNTYASIGRSSSADSLSSANYFSGWMSDFRIYATEFTADQVKKLYNTPISVANPGICMAESFHEGAEKVSFTKKGIVAGTAISELPGKYDQKVLVEPDGSCWAHIGHHADPGTYKFASGDPFSTGVWKDARRFLDPSFCNSVNKWEFIVEQRKTSSGSVERYRWSQPVNPNSATYSTTAASAITRYGTSDGYNSSSFGGMYYNGGSNSYYVCNHGTSGNWFGAIGCWSDYSTGIPAYNGGVIKDGGYTDLYIRIDNVTWVTNAAFNSPRTKCSLDQHGKSVLAPGFIEQ